MLTLVNLDQATNAELQIGSKSAGLDEKSDALTDLIEADGLTNAQRDQLITAVKHAGYKAIQIDHNRRITNPDVMVPFELAMLVE